MTSQGGHDTELQLGDSTPGVVTTDVDFVKLPTGSIVVSGERRHGGGGKFLARDRSASETFREL